jgi:hypothetical protein
MTSNVSPFLSDPAHKKLTSLRFAELALISLPLWLIAAWLLGVRHASFRAFMAMALCLAGLGLALLWFSEQRSFTGAYTPASLQNGKVVREQGP